MTKSKMPTEPQTAADAAVSFLQRHSPDGQVSVTAIHPDNGKIETRCFESSDAEALGQFIDRHNGQSNLYFAVNPLRHYANKKATKKDAASLAWLHVDIDPRGGEDLDEERERIRKSIDDFPLKPTIVIDSGNGYQAFWRLTSPVRVDGNIEELEAYNVRLEKHFGADSCHNIDRIMRLPCTTNLPDAKKRAKGRKPAQAALEYFGEESYGLEEFGPAPSPAAGPVALASAAPRNRAPGPSG